MGLEEDQGAIGTHRKAFPYVHLVKTDRGGYGYTMSINPYPAPGNVVGTVHGRWDTRTAAGGTPEPARYPPITNGFSRDPLSVYNIQDVTYKHTYKLY